jgi:hypothetical protein
MAQLAFPIVGHELLVDVRINLSAPELALLRAAQQPAPTSAVTRGILDTGSNATGVAGAILRQFQLAPVRHSTTQGIGGASAVDLYHVSLSIFDSTQLLAPWFVQPDLQVMELPPGFPVDVLIGMDVLLQLRMLIDGPGSTFTLDF